MQLSVINATYDATSWVKKDNATSAVYILSISNKYLNQVPQNVIVFEIFFYFTISYL
jgi:hypothetical protein